MSEAIVSKTICDYCEISTFNPGIAHWYIVTGRLGTVSDACIDCGHQINRTLVRLGIEHLFDCKQYSEGNERGRIAIR